jgi:hypothetical protein
VGKRGEVFIMHLCPFSGAAAGCHFYLENVYGLKQHC